jgi:hypothetical protein
MDREREIQIIAEEICQQAPDAIVSWACWLSDKSPSALSIALSRKNRQAPSNGIPSFLLARHWTADRDRDNDGVHLNFPSRSDIKKDGLAFALKADTPAALEIPVWHVWLIRH